MSNVLYVINYNLDNTFIKTFIKFPKTIIDIQKTFKENNKELNDLDIRKGKDLGDSLEIGIYGIRPNLFFVQFCYELLKKDYWTNYYNITELFKKWLIEFLIHNNKNSEAKKKVKIKKNKIKQITGKKNYEIKKGKIIEEIENTGKLLTNKRKRENNDNSFLIDYECYMINNKDSLLGKIYNNFYKKNNNDESSLYDSYKRAKKYEISELKAIYREKKYNDCQPFYFYNYKRPKLPFL